MCSPDYRHASARCYSLYRTLDPSTQTNCSRTMQGMAFFDRRRSYSFLLSGPNLQESAGKLDQFHRIAECAMRRRSSLSCFSTHSIAARMKSDRLHDFARTARDNRLLRSSSIRKQIILVELVRDGDRDGPSLAGSFGSFLFQLKRFVPNKDFLNGLLSDTPPPSF